MGNKLMLM